MHGLVEGVDDGNDGKIYRIYIKISLSTDLIIIVLNQFLILNLVFVVEASKGLHCRCYSLVMDS